MRFNSEVTNNTHGVILLTCVYVMCVDTCVPVHTCEQVATLQILSSPNSHMHSLLSTKTTRFSTCLLFYVNTAEWASVACGPVHTPKVKLKVGGWRSSFCIVLLGRQVLAPWCNEDNVAERKRWKWGKKVKDRETVLEGTWRRVSLAKKESHFFFFEPGREEDKFRG